MDQSEWAVVDGHNNSFSCTYDAKNQKKKGSFSLIKLFVHKLFSLVCGVVVMLSWK
jgi:hypothetical protein